METMQIISVVVMLAMLFALAQGPRKTNRQ